MLWPRWKRRSFVDDGIPPNKIPCRSGFHRWNGLRHDLATMETKIIRGRWNPSQQNTMLVGAPPLEWPPAWLGHDGNEDHSWTMESLPTKYPAGRGSTAGMASDMVGPRLKRRSFVDDGIPPDKVSCRSRFHCWNGLRHGWATMETKIIRGRWNPSQQNTLLVEVPPLEWPPTWLGHDGNGYPSWTLESPQQNTLPVGGPPLKWPPTWLVHDGNEDPSWTIESLPTKHPVGRGSTAGLASDMVGRRWKRRSFVDDGIPPDKISCRSRFHRWNGLRHGRATTETKILRGRWDPSRQNILPVEVPPLEWPPTWLAHDGNEDHSWTMGSLPPS